MTDLLISGLIIHTGREAITGGSVWIKGQRIHEIFHHDAPDFSGRRLEFPSDYHLTSGRIDMHIHGAAGADVMDATPEALDKIRQALAAEGVTGFLATTVTESVEKIDAALQNIHQYLQSPQVSGAEIIGVHLEGPFISPLHAGAHRKELLLAPDIELFDRWQRLAGGKIKLVTLAPELEGGLEFISHLSKQGVIPSIGHTDADFALTQQAVAAGAKHATHLFNAMRPFHHREPGCIGAILQSPELLAEIIADGHHCHPAALDLAWRLKGREGLVLVTDAMRAKCCAVVGDFDLGGQAVTICDGAARLTSGVLAGSVLTMTQAIKNILNFTDCTLDDLIYLTSLNPAKALKIDDCTGSIDSGKNADLTVLDRNLDVVLTIANGEGIYYITA